MILTTEQIKQACLSGNRIEFHKGNGYLTDNPNKTEYVVTYETPRLTVSRTVKGGFQLEALLRQCNANNWDYIVKVA